MLGLGGISLAAGCGVLPMPAGPKPKRIFRVGFLKQPPLLNYMDAFSDGMRELGWEEDRDYILDYIYVEDVNNLPAAVDQLLKVPVDILVCPNAGAVDVARKASSIVPIVFVTAANPLASGYVETLARPGGNLTGPSQLAPGVTSKRLEILNEISPGIRRFGVIWNPGNATSADQWQETQETAATLGQQTLSLEVREPGDFAAAFALAEASKVDALFMPITQIVMVQMPLIAQFALAHRLPAMAFQREFPDAGGLISYGASISALYRRAAYYVDRILKGASPATLPVEQPTVFDLILNQRTARALGLTIPQSVMALVSEVLE
jgi:ABC-type uncharacterized transport system substrate-binding protein